MRSHFLRAQRGNIQYVNYSSAQTTGSTTIVLSPPTGWRVNDLLVAVALNTATSANTWSASSGWTEVLDTSGRGIFWKKASASEGDLTLTGGGTNNKSGFMLAYRNAVFDEAGTSIVDPAGAITLDANGSVVILWSSRATATNVTWGAETGFTLLASDGDATAPSHAVYHKLNQLAGSTGTFSISQALATGVLIGIKPG
jgi:hypothetical protein